MVHESKTEAETATTVLKRTHLFRSTVGLEINDVNVSDDIMCKITVKTLKKNTVPCL